ncbi:hypothetical protein MPLA_1530037 [Mesorhizobium sp. ORS 3359]|nr:hypothetical protein MPLA_1530037 [Mesorhizobium sp. ORS 3359]
MQPDNAGTEPGSIRVRNG